MQNLNVSCLNLEKVPALDLEREDEPTENLTPMQQIESARNKWRKKETFNLEESWTSLNLFDRLQKGRISMDLEGTKRLSIQHF